MTDKRKLPSQAFKTTTTFSNEDFFPPPLTIFLPLDFSTIFKHAHHKDCEKMPPFQCHTWKSLFDFTSRLVILRWTTNNADLGLLFSPDEDSEKCKERVLVESGLRSKTMEGKVEERQVVIQRQSGSNNTDANKGKARKVLPKEEDWEKMSVDSDTSTKEIQRREKKKRKSRHRKLSERSRLEVYLLSHSQLY